MKVAPPRPPEPPDEARRDGHDGGSDRVVRGLELGAWSCGLEIHDGLAQVRATIASGLTAGMPMPYPDLPEWRPQ